MNKIIIGLLLSLILCRSIANTQLTSPGEAVCIQEQVVFVCQQSDSFLRWEIDLPGETIFTNSASSSQAGTVTVLNFTNDPGFGFEIHVLSSSSSSSVITELHVTAVRELNGATVECIGPSGSFMSTIDLVDPPAAPSGVTTADQSQFTPSTASITLAWSASSGADNYTIMVTPLLPSGQSLVSTTTTSLQLTVLYNEEYFINITAHNCAGSNSTVAKIQPFSIIGCSPPSPLANGSFTQYIRTAVGAMLTFQCDTGYMPQEEVASTCLSNSQWVPTPECEGSDTSENSDTLSSRSQVIITVTAIVCSLVFLLFGMFLGGLLVYCIMSHKNKINKSSTALPSSSTPVIYEEVSPDSNSQRRNDNIIMELSENVAYGPVTK